MFCKIPPNITVFKYSFFLENKLSHTFELSQDARRYFKFPGKMQEYKVISTDENDLGLYVLGSCVGILKYKKWWNESAEILLANNVSYNIEQKSFHNRIFEVKNGDTVVLSYDYPWKCGIYYIRPNSKEGESCFIFKRTGFFKQVFIFETEDQEIFATIKRKYILARAEYEYLVNVESALEKFPHIEVILLVLIHCMIHYEVRIGI